MTNTGDFRRYSYSTEAAYAVQAFNYQRTSASRLMFLRQKRILRLEKEAKEKAKPNFFTSRNSLKKSFANFSGGGFVPYYAFCSALY